VKSNNREHKTDPISIFSRRNGGKLREIRQIHWFKNPRMNMNAHYMARQTTVHSLTASAIWQSGEEEKEKEIERSTDLQESKHIHN
jgi:hypothetical protein